MFAHFRSALKRTDFENDFFVYVYGWNNIFTCFYMPAFFKISGYCSSFRKDIASFTKSLLKKLVLPLFTLSIINDISYSLLVTHQDLYLVFLNVIKNGGTLWFIQALIIAKVICYTIYRMFKSNVLLMIITAVLLILGVVLNQFTIGFNLFYYQHGLVASFFVALGLFLKDNAYIYEKLLKICLWGYPFIGIINFWYSPNITAVLSVWIKAVPLFLLLSTCGTLFLLSICKRINENKWIEYWGQNSLIVYALHFAPLVFLFKYLYICMQPKDAFAFVCFVVVLMTIEYLLCFLMIKISQYKPFKWLLGHY